MLTKKSKHVMDYMSKIYFPRQGKFSRFVVLITAILYTLFEEPCAGTKEAERETQPATQKDSSRRLADYRPISRPSAERRTSPATVRTS